MVPKPTFPSTHCNLLLPKMYFCNLHITGLPFLTTMKHLQKAISDFQQSQEGLIHAQQRRLQSQQVRHYSNIRRWESRNETSLPCLATHYKPQLMATAINAPSIRHQLGLLANQDNGLPISFLHNSSMFIVNTGASITNTNSRSDFSEPLHSVQPTVLQGIVSGLNVRGISTATYKF
jgi:hypothetical protein